MEVLALVLEGGRRQDLRHNRLAWMLFLLKYPVGGCGVSRPFVLQFSYGGCIIRRLCRGSTITSQ
jgi:hypothetical protein